MPETLTPAELVTITGKRRIAAQGAEGRDHDTPDGDAQRALEAVHSAVAAMVAAERERCVALIETYRVPVGNSRSGEMAAEWTLDALREVRDKIRKLPNA